MSDLFKKLRRAHRCSKCRQRKDSAVEFRTGILCKHRGELTSMESAERKRFNRAVTIQLAH